MSRVGIIPDLHEPFTHPMFLDFVQDTFEQYNVNRYHFIGDIADNHAISFWEHDPDGHSSGDEYEHTKARIDLWYNLFPYATVSIGNHDERHFRVAKKAGLSAHFIQDYKKVWNTPRWKWEFSHEIDGIHYTHGTGTSGKDAAFNLATQKRMSTVIGHVHSYAGIKWHSNPHNAIFGMNVGCGIDVRAYAFAYGRDLPVRPMLGCGIVLDGWMPIFVPMRCGTGEKYHRGRA